MQVIDTPKPLPQLVYDAVLNAICEGTLKPRQRVTQDDIARRLNVSRLPVGQALRQLEAEGFLRPAGRRGLQVAPVTRDLVRDLYGMRAGIDLVSAGLAAQAVDRRFVSEGLRILADGRSAVAAKDIPLLISADWEFHWLIYETAGNAKVLEVMASQWHHTRRVMTNVIDDTENQGPIWEQHRQIFEAVRAGDADAAERLSRDHVDRASSWLAEAAESLTA